MKSLIKIIASILTAVLLLSPISALAATSVPWTIQNITDTFISPGLVNGLFKGIFVTASSTIGDGTLGLTINGNATTTGNALFAGNLSVTGSTILNGFISQASSTIGNGTLGLTVNGNSTTTGTAFFNGNVGIGSTTPFGKLSITNMGSSPSIAIEGGNIIQVASSTPVVTGSVTDSSLNVPRNMTISGNYAYITSTVSNSLTIVDVSSSTAPRVLTSTTTTQYLNFPTGVAVSGNYAYVAGRTVNRLTVFDVSNPSSITEVGSVTNAGSLNTPNSVAVSGSYAYVAGSGNSLTVVNIADPTNPTIVGFIIDNVLLNNARAVVVSGKYAYVAAAFNGSVTVIDISRPDAPIIVGSVTDNTATLRGVVSLAKSGSYLYAIASTTKTFTAIDVSNPTAPTIAGSFVDARFNNGNSGSSGSMISVAGNYAYVAGSSGDLITMDISNPAVPRFVSALHDVTNFQNALAIGVSGRYAYIIGTISTHFTVVDLNNSLQTPTIQTGSISTDNINVKGSMTVAGDILSNGGLNVGLSGIFSRGGIFVSAASSTAANPIAGLFMNGSVGIGTTSPWGNLSVINTVVGNPGFVVSSMSNVPQFLISAGGNVGVGTSSPWRTFSVNGTVGFSGLSSGSGSNLCLSSSNELVTCTVSASASYPFALSGNATSTLTQFNAGLTAFASSTIGDGTQIGGLTVSGGATTTGNAYFTNTVGIASTSPWAGLSVDTTGLAVGMPSFSVGSSTRQDFLITQSGRIDIGTTTDPYTTAVAIPLLNVAGSIQIGKAGQTFNGLDIVRNDGVSGTGLLEWSGSTTFQLTNGSGGGILRLGAVSSAGGSIQFLGNSSSLLGTIVNSTGFFGIGTTTPWGQISASSTSANPTLAIEQHGSGPAGIFIGGNVGIGTTSPFLKLAVIGSFGVATSTNSGLPNFEIDTSGHTLTSGSPPTFGACGTNPNFVGPANDTDMTINIGSGVVSSCTINFALSYPTNATVGCSLSQIGGSFATSIESSTTPAAVVINGGTITSDRYYLHCQASQ